MEFAPPSLDLAKLKRKVDIRSLVLHIDGVNFFEKGRFYMLWKNGIFIVIQAEPWWRPDRVSDDFPSAHPSHYMEEYRALWYLQEVIQTMVETIEFDGENNWAYLVRLKDSSYRLVYKKRQLVQNCPIWTKVVELDDIEVTRFVSGFCWEGIYEGDEVDLLIGWRDDWAACISAESRGLKLIQSRGLGRYFFDLKAHVSQNGVIVGIMMEPIVGRCVTHADHSAVFEALADIQQHGVSLGFQIYDIYITEHGVRFASASSAKYYQDRDALAKEAEYTWKALVEDFNRMDDNLSRGVLSGSRNIEGSSALIIPRLPSPRRPITLSPEEAIIRWVWSIVTSDEYCCSQAAALKKLQRLGRSSKQPAVRRGRWIKGDDRALLPPDDLAGDPEASAARIESVDEPVSCAVVARWHPYARPASKRLLLPRESDLAAPVT